MKTSKKEIKLIDKLVANYIKGGALAGCRNRPNCARNCNRVLAPIVTDAIKTLG